MSAIAKFWMQSDPSGWETKPLGSLSSVKARLGWKGLKADEYVQSGYIFLSTPNLKGDAIDFDDVNYITKERYDESPEIQLQLGDLLLVKDGATLGIVAHVQHLPAPATVNGSTAVIHPKTAIDSRFLYYWLKSDGVQQLIGQLKGGMGVPHLFQSDIRRIPVSFPDLPWQRRIAAWLDEKTAKIDRLIELRRKQIATVEAKAISSIHDAIVHGLDSAARQKNSGIPWIGAIPEHWQVKRLKHVAARIVTGSTPPSGRADYFSEDGHHWYGPGDLHAFELEAAQRRVSAKAIADGEVVELRAPVILLVGVGASVGKVAFARINCSTNQQINAVTIRSGHEAEYYARFLHAFGDVIDAHANHATLPIFNQTQTKNIPIIVPPLTEQRAIVAYTSTTMQDAIRARTAYERQISLLSDYRASILHEAVTGQLTP